MIQFPNCKLNLGLAVTEKRNDGFHNLETVFIPLSVCDALEFVESDELKLTLSGNEIPGNTNDNILFKAYHLLKNDNPDMSPIHIHLMKKIPTGGGLGGGSSNASSLLKMMNEFFNLNLNQEQLLNYALQLGSDCPFFILNTPCYATGRGEILNPISLDLSSYAFILVMPGIHVSTAQAFKSLVPRKPNFTIQKIIQEPISNWKDHLVNDFEKPIFQEFNILSKIKEELYQLGCIYAAMSGSGSTMFGMIEKNKLEELKQKLNSSEKLNEFKFIIVE